MSEQELDEQYARTLDIIERVELKNMLRNEGDKLGAVLKIVAGAGSTEAQDWASMLMRMYLRYCEANGYKTEMRAVRRLKKVAGAHLSPSVPHLSRHEVAQ